MTNDSVIDEAVVTEALVNVAKVFNGLPTYAVYLVSVNVLADCIFNNVPDPSKAVTSIMDTAKHIMTAYNAMLDGDENND